MSHSLFACTYVLQPTIHGIPTKNRSASAHLQCPCSHHRDHSPDHSVGERLLSTQPESGPSLRPPRSYSRAGTNSRVSGNRTAISPARYENISSAVSKSGHFGIPQKGAAVAVDATAAAATTAATSIFDPTTTAAATTAATSVFDPPSAEAPKEPPKQNQSLQTCPSCGRQVIHRQQEFNVHCNNNYKKRRDSYMLFTCMTCKGEASHCPNSSKNTGHPARLCKWERTRHSYSQVMYWHLKCLFCENIFKTRNKKITFRWTRCDEVWRSHMHACTHI